MTKNKNKKSVNLDDISIEDIANRLVQRLDRGHIFPPYYNDPEYFIPTVSGKKSFHKPKRPQNSFLLCRKNVHNEAKRQGACNMRIVSKVTGILWRDASLQERLVYERLADRNSFTSNDHVQVINHSSIDNLTLPLLSPSSTFQSSSSLSPFPPFSTSTSYSPYYNRRSAPPSQEGLELFPSLATTLATMPTAIKVHIPRDIADPSP
ncbi:14112_t:CDS:2 [Entrophospora sp. SA101]|nr:14112_t:CDS:2 [Entrophospora sp. SA101]